jgi:MoxR-like ATPase
MPTQTPTLTSSDFNLEKLNTKDLSEHFTASIKMGGNIAVFGRRGTGKTEIAKHEIRKADMQEVYINLSVMERVDLVDIQILWPQLNKRNMLTFYSLIFTNK